MIINVCRIERKYGFFSRMDACSYVLNVFDDGNVLSIVTDSSPHGTHVAGITAAHHPEVCLHLLEKNHLAWVTDKCLIPSHSVDGSLKFYLSFVKKLFSCSLTAGGTRGAQSYKSPRAKCLILMCISAWWLGATTEWSGTRSSDCFM